MASTTKTSNDIAFRIAAGDAFEKALSEAGPVLLEPIMKLDISTPEEYLGDFVGDLQQRRSIIVKTEARGKLSFVEARAPLAELFGYSSAMRSLSQGRAGCSMEPLGICSSTQKPLSIRFRRIRAVTVGVSRFFRCLGREGRRRRRYTSVRLALVLCSHSILGLEKRVHPTA